MSNPTAPPAPPALKIDPNKIAKALPPHLECTFAGHFYKSVGGGKGKEHAPFEKTVKVPLSVVMYEGLSPIGFFEKYHARKMVAELGGVIAAEGRQTRICDLVATKGDLPNSLMIERKLLWTASVEGLKEIADGIPTQRYIQTDLATGEQAQKQVTIKPELFPDPTKLRDAISLILSEPEAFAREQQRLIDKDAAAPKSMEAEIAELLDA